MLDRAASFDAAERVYRITLNPDKFRRLQRLRQEIGDGPELAEAIDFLGERSVLDASTLDDLLRVPFTRKATSGRFSNGDYGVLYTARERETAAQEYAYWAPRYLPVQQGRTVRVRLHLISCWFEGRAKDMTQFLDECPWLISDDYAECQRLGASARGEGLAGLIAPSARRRPDGSTVPIFISSTATQPMEEDEVVFIIGTQTTASFQFGRDQQRGGLRE